MNHKLPILLAAGVLAAGCLTFAQGQFDTSPDSITGPGDGAGGEGTPAAAKGTNSLVPPPEGAALLRQSIAELNRQPAIECRVRQRLWLYDHQYIGSGHYRQLGQGANKFLLWELKMEINGEITSLKQVSDRRFLWIHRNFAERTEQSLVDLRRIREARNKVASPTRLPAAPWLAVGGLPRLLQGLEVYFQFGEVRAETLGEYPVWVLEGRWAPPGPVDEAGERSPHVPDRVLLVLGRDPVLPLFPYRIEFQRDELVEGRNRATPLLRMEFFEIRRAPLVPEQFVFDPGDNPVTDETDRYLDMLGLKDTAREK